MLHRVCSYCCALVRGYDSFVVISRHAPSHRDRTFAHKETMPMAFIDIFTWFVLLVIIASFVVIAIALAMMR